MSGYPSGTPSYKCRLPLKNRFLQMKALVFVPRKPFQPCQGRPELTRNVLYMDKLRVGISLNECSTLISNIRLDWKNSQEHSPCSNEEKFFDYNDFRSKSYKTFFIAISVCADFSDNYSLKFNPEYFLKNKMHF